MDIKKIDYIYKNLNVEAWNSIWNHEFWSYSWKIGCGNVKGASTHYWCLWKREKSIQPSGWQQLCLNSPVETWNTHSSWQCVTPKNLTIHQKNWMWKRGNTPIPVNFYCIHDKLDVEMWKCSSNQLNFDGPSLKMPVET